MSAPIWQKENSHAIDKKLMQYMAGEDYLLDQHLLSYDIEASQAHVAGLHRTKILTEEDSKKLIDTLEQLKNQVKDNTFDLCTAFDGEQFEDGHSAIEYYLTQKLGDLGKKVHTGRSRNDQVLVATRLYMKNALQDSITHAENSVEVLINKAKASADQPMPGYTHLQRAVPSSCGMWFAGFAESMLDNIIILKSTLELIDSNPLGTAAGYGVNLDLDRSLTTQKLGFSRIQLNPIYAQNSRGKLELNVLSALANCLLDIRRFCWDLSLFTTQEFDLVELPDQMTTGSSIMPNKRNPDLIELMRAAYVVVQGAKTELESLLSLPSGYQRDLQLTKPPLVRGLTKAIDTLALFPQVISAVQFKSEKLEASIDAPMFATDYANQLAVEGVPFRDAYKMVKDKVKSLENLSASESIQARTSQGACGNLQLETINERFLDIKRRKY